MKFNTVDEFVETATSDSDFYRRMYEGFLLPMFRSGLNHSNKPFLLRVFNVFPSKYKSSFQLCTKGPLYSQKYQAAFEVFEYYYELYYTSPYTGTMYLDGTDTTKPTKPTTKLTTEPTTNPTNTTNMKNQIAQFATVPQANLNLVFGVNIEQADEESLLELAAHIGDKIKEQEDLQKSVPNSKKVANAVQSLNKLRTDIVERYDSYGQSDQ